MSQIFELIVTQFSESIFERLLKRDQKVIKNIVHAAKLHHAQCDEGATCIVYCVIDAAIFCRFDPEIMEQYVYAERRDFEIMRSESLRWRNYRALK